MHNVFLVSSSEPHLSIDVMVGDGVEFGPILLGLECAVGYHLVLLALQL